MFENISFELFSCWLRINPIHRFSLHFDQMLVSVTYCHLILHSLELLHEDSEGDGHFPLLIPIPGEEVLLDPGHILATLLQPGTAELLKEPREYVVVGILPIPVLGGAEALHPGRALAAPLDVLGGDVGGILGQVLGEHELGIVERVPGDTVGEGDGSLLGNLGNFKDLPIISGHLW